MTDCAVAIENMMLAAHSLGLGSCWLNQLPGLTQMPQARALMDELGIPENHMIFGTFAVGYPAVGFAEATPAKGHSRIRILE